MCCKPEPREPLTVSRSWYEAQRKLWLASEDGQLWLMLKRESAKRLNEE